MDIFVRNIPWAATEMDVVIELARILHKPPFPNPHPPTNFHFALAVKNRNSHRGYGTLTLPNPSIGETLLSVYELGGLSVKGRSLQISRSNHPLKRGIVEKLRTTHWQDPQVLQEEQERRISASGPIKLAQFSFGRFCRDGSFSANNQLSGSGRIICDLSSRQLRLEVEHMRDNSGDEQNDVGIGSVSVNLVNLGDMFRPQKSVIYVPTQIKSMIAPVNSGDPPYILFEAHTPPIFQELPFFSERSNRHWSLHNDRDMPPACTALRLTFNSHGDREVFLGRGQELHLPAEQKRDVVHDTNSDYSIENMASLNKCLLSLEFGLAFQAERAVVDSVLKPTEILSLKENMLQLQQDHGTHASAVFQYFVETLRESYRDLRSRRRRRGRRNRPTVTTEPVKLPELLDEAVASFFTERARPRLYSFTSPSFFQSYHLIITPSTRILEGPLPDQSNSVLRRFGNHDCFIRVSFYDESRSPLRRDPNADLSSLLQSRFRKLLIDGLRLAGREYEFLGYSMSGLRDHSVWFVSPFEFEGRMIRALDIRDLLGDFSAIAHEPARLGARWSQAFSATDPTMELDPSEIRGDLEDRVSSSGSVFTDGVSTISTALAKSAWSILRSQKGQVSGPRDVPSCFQFRLGGSKGVVVVDPTLAGRLICLRKSQTKFEAPSVRTLDIQSTSSRPRFMFLNRPMIVILEYLGVPKKSFIDLQDIAIHDVEIARASLWEASKLLGQHGLGGSFRLPSLFSNIKSQLRLDVQDSPESYGIQHHLITEAIRCACTHATREIKYRAHIRVPGSVTLLGIADEWGCLRAGEIYATILDERIGLLQPIEGKVLITRSPQVHPGDLQFVNAVRRPELSHLHNVVVFSCEGERSLPSCLAGGDLDGDDYNLILDPNLHPPRTVTPGGYKGVPNKRTERPCAIADIADFVIDYIESDLLGYISILHLRFADLNDPGCDECIVLAEKASHAVDFPKTGVPVEFSSLPRPPQLEKPDFLAGEGAGSALGVGFYPSEKVLGALFRRVPLDTRLPGFIPESPSDGTTIEHSLHIEMRVMGLPPLDEPSGDLKEEMTHILEAYSDQLHVIARTHTLSKNPEAYLQEAELVSGTIMSKWADHRKRREAVTAMNLQTQQLTRAIRREFAREIDQETVDDEEWDSADEDEEEEMDRRRKMEILKRAWAAWNVAEEALDDDRFAFGPMSFGLIALGTILEVVKKLRFDRD